MSNMPKSYEHLYATPIEEMDLSEAAIKTLKKTGITTIGDCIDFYIRFQDALIPAHPPFFSITGGEVKQKMRAWLLVICRG
jgi:hypothetical protein